jgi:hypothetical protein
LLEEACISPTPAFSQKLHDHLAQQLARSTTNQFPAARPPASLLPGKNKPFTWRQTLGGVLVFGLVLFLLVALVPAVQAQVVSLLQQFGVQLPFTSQGLVISPFTPLAPEKIPAQMSYFASLNQETNGSTYIELRYFSQDKFIVIYETPAQPGKNLPQGESVRIGNNPATMDSDISGMVFLAAQAPQPWRQAGNGGGGGNSDDTVTAAPPQQLVYSSATRLTWIQSGLYIEFLSNLPHDEALRLAASLIPAPQLKK